SAQSERSRRPTMFEPVKVRAVIPGLASNASPMTSDDPVTTLSTPAGNPASASTCARRIAVSGAICAGFQITVFPNASAGAIFHAGIAAGKFHGVITATTPTGTRVVYKKRADRL